MTIARNAVIDEVRRERHAPSLDDPAVQPWLVDGRRSPEDLAIASDEQRRVERALARLPATQRRIVELRLIGMRSAEIAEILAMSQSAVDTAHFRAYARLREWLAEPDDHQGPAR
ncbi:MAG: sigma-70 family RNA polymerase sigma factor [Chloroflexota bacterium]|nr:sigma-70 family RNA polymerase sigma factor [Chloroflexota bacterium]